MIHRRLATAFGWSVVVFGILIIPLPGPMGTPTAFAGFLIVLSNSARARRQFIRWQKRHPRTFTPIRALIRRSRQWRQRFARQAS
ncbi:MAG: PGPGW domain-containing protein [Geminicoccaceae bacterium]